MSPPPAIVRSRRDAAGRQIWYINDKRVSKQKAMKAKGISKPKPAKRARRCTAANPCARTKSGQRKKRTIQRKKRTEYGYAAPTYYAYAQCSNPPPCNWDHEEFDLASGEKCCRKKY
uniref:Uncharacterized protein n=1 Tax=Clandestinovirus TaxID=2831644 RepID=A0A8F8PNC6_9VIRU|nr:hypothetical protein KOM_12_429 [Clandestinovirus]